MFRSAPPFPRAAAGGEAYLGAEQAALGVAERERARPRVVGKGFVPGFKQLFGKPAGGDIGEAQGVGIAGCRREQAAGRVVDDQQPARGDVEREDGIADAADVHLAGPGPPVRRIRRREEGFLEEPVIKRVVFAGPALQDVRPVAVRQPEGDGGGAAGKQGLPPGQPLSLRRGSQRLPLDLLQPAADCVQPCSQCADGRAAGGVLFQVIDSQR